MSKVIINGELVEESGAGAVVSLLDRNVQLGMNVFETMLAVRGVIDGFDLHIARLEMGMERLGISLEVSTLRKFILMLLEANELDSENARVRVTAMEGSLMIQASRAEISRKSINVVISDYVLNERSATAGIKCGSYAANVVAMREAEDADEILFLNTVGEVAEAGMANVFIVSDGKLITPRLESGCLAGVTRELLMRRAVAAGVEVQECAVLLEHLFDADEVFLTNSVAGVTSVARVGEVELEGDSMTEKLRGIYQDGDQ